MEERKWEDMNTSCLVNIFGRLDLESRLLDVPYVCKHWHKALLNPLCWQSLVFPFKFDRSRLYYGFTGRHSNISKLIKFVVDRSQGCATELALPDHTTLKDLVYVSDACPTLKVLSLAYVDFLDGDGSIIPELFVKWKSLEILKVKEGGYDMEQIINEIGSKCNSFVGLYLSQLNIGNQVVQAMVSKLGTIKLLVLDNNHIEKENLVLILRGCKQIELLYVRSCIGFDEDDNEIRNLSSGIKDFRCNGSTTNIYDSDEGEDFYW